MYNTATPAMPPADFWEMISKKDCISRIVKN